jgi:hypothetical protein
MKNFHTDQNWMEIKKENFIEKYCRKSQKDPIWDWKKSWICNSNKFRFNQKSCFNNLWETLKQYYRIKIFLIPTYLTIFSTKSKSYFPSTSSRVRTSVLGFWRIFKKGYEFPSSLFHWLRFCGKILFYLNVFHLINPIKTQLCSRKIGKEIFGNIFTLWVLYINPIYNQIFR